MSPTTITSPSSSSSPSLLPQTSSSQKRNSLSHRQPTSHATNYSPSEFSSSSTPPTSMTDSYVPLLPLLSLPYTIVRDFAYSTSHPMHCGTIDSSSQISSELSTPISDNADCLSDALNSWEIRSCWGTKSYGDELIESEQLDDVKFGDGPPWSEDEDLQSPVVVSPRHRKHKSCSTCGGRSRSSKETGERLKSMIERTGYEHEGRYYLSSEDSCQRFYVRQKDESDGHGSNIAPFSSNEALHFDPYDISNRRDSHFAGILPKRTYADVIHDFSGSETSSAPSSPNITSREETRYSRDYQFTITSSDEEMHGKAVALFDFISENENELPLMEGQVIWVSYRYGQGWLVAEDPKTRENGLVPESYVRLLRDTHGDLNSTTGHVCNG